MLKKILLTVAVSGMFFVSGINSSAKAEGVTIGIVDTQAIIAKSSLYSALRKAEGELRNLEQGFQKDYMDKMARLQKAKNKEEFERLQKQFEGELMQKREQAMKTLQVKQASLESMKNDLRKKVENAIKAIAKQKNLTYVVDKQAMFYGGADITEDVLKRVK